MGEIELIRAWNRRRRPPAGGGLGSARNALADQWWELIELPRQARWVGAQIIHHPLPAVSAGSGCREVVSLMDLAFERLPECFDPRFRLYAHHVHRSAARRAAAVVCISQTTARDAEQLWGIESRRRVVAPLGPGQLAGVALAPAPEPAPARHLLYVGDAEPRKNLPLLLAGYSRYRERVADPRELVLAGTAHVPGLRTVERPDASTLAALYAQAEALVQPSRYEGFGMTALEAMAMGVPVIAARSPGLTETCADAALYFQTAEELAGALDVVGSRRQELVARGRARAAQFSWERCARAHLDAYSLALG